MATRAEVWVNRPTDVNIAHVVLQDVNYICTETMPFKCIVGDCDHKKMGAQDSQIAQLPKGR